MSVKDQNNSNTKVNENGQYILKYVTAKDQTNINSKWMKTGYPIM